MRRFLWVWIGAGLVACGVAAYAAFAALQKEAPIAPAAAMAAKDMQDQLTYWRERVRVVGPVQAHAEFVHEEGEESPLSHTHAHIFGEALYREAGMSGYVCDERFGGGCSHQFIGLAISEYGAPIIQELRDACARSARPAEGGRCIHSIGHGLVGYYGYTIEEIRESIAGCRSVFAVEHTLCFFGVFMEYLVQRMTSGGEISVRSADERGMYGICTEFDGVEGWACAYVLPWWWHLLLQERGMTDEAAIAGELGDACRAYVPLDRRDACYGGIAYTTALRRVSPSMAAEHCVAAAADEDSLRTCLTHLHYWLSRFYEEWHEEGDVSMVCAALEGEARRDCLSRDPFAP